MVRKRKVSMHETFLLRAQNLSLTGKKMILIILEVIYFMSTFLFSELLKLDIKPLVPRTSNFRDLTVFFIDNLPQNAPAGI